MQGLSTRLSQSASVKALVIAFLILVLLVPLAMIRGVIYERVQTGDSARNEVQRTWGNAQTVGGPVLVVPFRKTHTPATGPAFVSRHYFYLLPENLDIEGRIDPEVLHRGIYDIPVYSSEMQLRGTFAAAWQDKLAASATDIDWEGIYIALAVSDGRAITEIPVFDTGDQQIRFAPSGEQLAGLPPQFVAPIGARLNSARLDKAINFRIGLKLNGSESLRFVPVGDTTQVSLQSSWANPSFSGNYLPESREGTENGFIADWRVSSIGRALPSHWTSNDSIRTPATESAFGVDLYMPISVYRLTERATKYGILFIGLTFVAYFLFEVVAGMSLHPLQYLLVGFANSLFYLLLLSLAEHLGFGLSYLVSGAASCALIAGYSLSILGEAGRAMIMAVILALLYGFLYMTLKAENYALLVGAIGLWVSLGATMYLTRRIDWYGKPAAAISGS